MFSSGHGVCRVDKDTQGGWGGPTSALHAHSGGDPVFDWSPPDPLLQTGQHRRAVAASLKHWLYREKVISFLFTVVTPFPPFFRQCHCQIAVFFLAVFKKNEKGRLRSVLWPLFKAHHGFVFGCGCTCLSTQRCDCMHQIWAFHSVFFPKVPLRFTVTVGRGCETVVTGCVSLTVGCHCTVSHRLRVYFVWLRRVEEL